MSIFLGLLGICSVLLIQTEYGSAINLVSTSDFQNTCRVDFSYPFGNTDTDICQMLSNKRHRMGNVNTEEHDTSGPCVTWNCGVQSERGSNESCPGKSCNQAVERSFRKECLKLITFILLSCIRLF
ncbi:hypothetical protein D915_000571 [Fasciola hepatica]|uniref:Uncharacterized protein n=1 Tax=Fasciola hepatica TaxID=6192 RepID=A0A4E0RL63_FASHE|nr:hypothetical protein D915_000571 [Fasciola hepatica]